MNNPTIPSQSMKLTQQSSENALLATSLLFQLHKTYRVVGTPHSSNTTSISRMKGEEARQLRECQVFLDFVCDCYRELNKAGGGSSLQKNFDFVAQNSGTHAGNLSTPTSTGNSTTAKESIPSLPSKQSFRVLTECPLTVMLLFQLYPNKFLKTNIPVMIPLMMDSLKLVPPRFVDPSKVEDTPAKQGSHEGILCLSHTPITPVNAKATKETPKGETPLQPPDKTTNPMASTPVSSLSKENLLRLYRSRAHELIAAQVKTLSFLTYLLRGFADQMKPYEEVMAHNVVCLLKHCPREALSTRKELLVATRHILATDFRRGFFRHVDVLMDERIIAGNSRYSIAEQSLRPLGYSTLADLIHHARTRLTPAQLGRAVRIFSRVLHDVGMNMPLSMQITAVRLLLHLVDQIFNNSDPNPQLGRDLLVRILSTFIQKFRTIKETIPGLLESAEKEILNWNARLKPGSMSAGKGDNWKYEEDNTYDDASNNHSPMTILRDVQSLLRPMFQGMKTVMWCINSYAQQREKERQRAVAAGDEIFPLPPATNKENDEINSALLKITNSERELLGEYIVNGIPCLRAFRLCVEADQSIPPTPQYQDMVETFAASFTVVESFSLRRTILQNLPFMMGEMDTDAELIIMFKHLLLDSGKSVSYELCDLMFTYLAENIEELADLQTQDDKPQEKSPEENDNDKEKITYQPNNPRAQNKFKLFIAIFSSLTKYPKNEAALLPHLRTFVPDCIRRSMEGFTIGPGPYLCILRVLFRTLTGGKFEASYKEMAPLIPTILNGFYRIYLATDNESLRLMIVELMLTIPSRLSVLLPHLPLLVKILIPALRSNRGDLVNLALRNLEFWVDNLHGDYLYPVISQQSDTLCNLMISLTKHLQPAPYPYGLLCLRLLGKLGGKNRLFLHEVICQECDNKMSKPGVSIHFEWHGNLHESANASDESSCSFPLRLPLERAVDVLKLVSKAPHFVAKKDDIDTTTTRLPLDDQNSYFKCLFDERSEFLDLNAYAVDLMEKTKAEQANSAFAIIRGALASLLDVSADENFKTYVPRPDAQKYEEEVEPETDSHESQLHSVCTSGLKLICDGLFTATAIEELHKEALMTLKGFGSHIIFLLSSQINCVTRIDSDGAAVDSLHQGGFEQNHLGGKLQPLKPFGCFRLSGPLAKGVDPFVFNESLVDALAYSESTRIGNAANEVMNFIIELTQKLKSTTNVAEEKRAEDYSLTVGDVALENLLSCMCQACFGQSWNRRVGVMNGILQLLSKMGLQWSKFYEVEILHLAMFLVKDAPAEIARANKESMKFFVTITWFYFGGPASWDSSTLIYDVLSTKSTHNPCASLRDAKPPFISQASLTLILSEIGSTKHFVRFAVRHFLRIVTHDNPSIEFAIKEYVTSLKRLIFPRILRTSPLPEQVAILESIAFMIERAPLLFSIDDQTVLAFTAELLKMVSVADGDISDTFTSVVLIDKHGFAVSTESPSPPNHGMHTSSVFLNKSFKLQSDLFGGCVVVPEELPLGVQFRVASIYLFRSLIRRFPDHFFDADPKTQIGNLRPHVVSLLFRSLTAEPPEVVAAGESTLHDALLLGASEKGDSPEDQPKSSHRLPKELIQTCIRPILINLRDHTKLTIPLLRGIARLLSLLSSWFNKALGEKMIEHLSKFTEADKITSLQLWKSGDEPKVAAAVMDLFALLPQASRFVEALVKSTLRLEAAWSVPFSPFRDPLARYLNRHCASAVGFFLEEHRLCNPLYSELFVDILQRKSSDALREYISGKECTVMLLNVCFERPLAIIRSEKNASSPVSKANTTDHLAVYGVNPLNSYSAQRKLEIARQDIASKKNLLDLKNQEEASLKAAKLKSEDVTKAVERLKRELENARTAYSQEILQASSQKEVLTARPMTTIALELQHQGFKVIEILMLHNKIIQNDVLRAFRWLWRSRGRHYRLLYEEEIPWRYSLESLTLAKFLMAYSEAHPSDIDVLFDLIRIFLNPSSIDFSFVKHFLHRRVTNDLLLEQREQLLQRYLTLLTSEGSEENKIVSTTMLIYPMLNQIAQANDPTALKRVISQGFIKQFMEVILNGCSYSSKLTCQFLRVIDVLLEFMPNDLADFRKDLIKFIWSILKSDDSSTKYYGYLAVSRLVAAFEMPPKVTLQVLRSLLRSHNAPEKRMVRDSLNILVPALPSRLSSDELEVALKYTAKVIHEEGNSVQQLAHVLDSITSHPNVYYGHSSCLIPYMVHSLSSLGTSQNSPPEYKELSVAVAKLVFEWGETKLALSTAAKVETKANSNTLDPNTLDTIVNFAAKIILSNAETKVDFKHRQIHFQATSLLRDVLSYHPNATISAWHFEKVFSLGLDECEQRESSASKNHQEKSGDVSKKNEKMKKSSNEDATPKKRDDTGSLYTTLIIASLEIFSILLYHNPHSTFISLNACKMLASCFSNKVSMKDTKGKRLLKELVASIVAAGSLGSDKDTLVSLLEHSIVAASHKNSCDREESDQDYHKAYLAIEVIDEVCVTYPDFVEPFISSLTTFSKQQVKDHIQEAPKTATSMVAGGTNNLPPATSTLGIFEFACGTGFNAAYKGSDFTAGYEKSETQTLYEVERLKPSLLALILSLRLISSSSVLFTFSTTRKLYLEVISLILDSSVSLPLLMTTVGIISKVMRATRGVPFTRSEQEECLWRLAQIDFNKLPAAASQVLSDMICVMVLSTFGYYPSLVQEYPFECNTVCPGPFFTTNIKHSSDAPENVLKKLFSICLMSGNVGLRSIAVSIFAMDINDCAVVYRRLVSLAAKMHCRNGDRIDVVGIPDIHPYKVISLFLNCDLECLGKRLWTVLLVDLLLAVGKHDKGICLRGRWQGGEVSTSDSHKGFLRLRATRANEFECELDVMADEIYSAFVQHISSEKSKQQYGRGRCLSAIRSIAYADVETSQSILECCFQAAWQHLPSDEERSTLIQQLEKLLAMPSNTQFLKTSQCTPVNAIQSLVRLLIHLRPLPMIDTFLLLSLASDFGLYHEVFAYLEMQYLAVTRQSCETSSKSFLLLQAIHKCLACAGDRDVAQAACSAMCSSGTKLALSLEKYGFVKKATEAYLSLIERASEKNEFIPSEVELKLWEQHWLEAHKELSQWSVIDELSSSIGDKNIMIECAWKTKNWEKVRSLCGSPTIIASIEQGDSLAKMTEIFLAIHEGKLAEVENLHAQAAQLCLYKWQLLPAVGSGSSSHKDLFQQFQRLVELRESSQIMIETFSHSSRRSIPDLKSVLSSWRHRSPNPFEPVSVWEDLYFWRFHIFDAVAKNFSWTEAGTLATLHDRPYAAIKLGRAARKQDLKEVSMFLLSQLTDCMDVEDAFLKLREQIVSYQVSPDEVPEESTLKGGLNLVNSTNLTFFNARQKAELFRLKSYFFNALNDKSNAHKNYCHAVQLSPNYARAWIDWGHLCASLCDSSKNSAESKDPKHKMNIQYLAQAMGCYLEAVRCDACEQSREILPHCLSMLSLDSPQLGYLCKAFEARAPLSPAWVWLPWIPQLLTCLYRAEAHSVKAVLIKVANDHPQALYYSLRAFFLERRDIERSKDHDAGSKQEDDAQKHAEVLMSNLRKSHPVLWSKLEAILEDLIIRFRPSYEAELLATLKALLDKARAKGEPRTSGKDTAPDSKGDLLEYLHVSLSKISVKFFNREKPDSSKGRKTLLFEKKWHPSFHSDFLEKAIERDGEQGRASIDELIEKLDAWKTKLECEVALVPHKCYLQETSPSLSWYSGQSSDYWAGSCESVSLTLSNSQHDNHSTLDNTLYEATRSSALAAHKASSDAVRSSAKSEGLGGHEGGGSSLIEIPGQYAPTSSSILDLRPFPELHAKLVNFRQTLEVISSPSKQDQTVRQISMIGSDGKNYKFLLQLAIPYWTRTDERSAQLQYIMAKIMRKDIQTCRRCLPVRPNVVIPVAQRMRMIANETSYNSLDSAFHHVQGSKLDDLVAVFEEEVERLTNTQRTTHDKKQSHSVEHVKTDVYRHICQELVRPDILSKYMTIVIPSIERLVLFRKMFASQLSSNSVIQHAFAVIERNPLRFVFCNRTGKVLAQDFRFQYNQGLLEAHAVPFRMTRSIAEFIGPFLLEGIFLPSFVSISTAMNTKRTALEPILHLLLRDDIISWYTSKTQPRNDKKLQEMEQQLSDRARKNICYVQTCLQDCSSRFVENVTEEAVSCNPQPIDFHVRNLMDAATNEQNLSAMSPSYHAWL
ncbi:hypothetical protein HJC23_004647 [Cyclotella cryptica]|uniref:Non-specific serine/threonine protein kinase n=1 Tax=Cyclotella cryptica TaxID=29204 RepID=A0ABD3QFN0_9STRA|eukprot:CCRYP_005974-RA/>CCRYP_005974-RA protein AED:0.03 eAED:0.03 QI:1382/1/1/1/1/1/15/598/4204